MIIKRIPTAQERWFLKMCEDNFKAHIDIVEHAGVKLWRATNREAAAFWSVIWDLAKEEFYMSRNA